MSTRLIFGAVSFCIGMTGVMLGNMFLYMMIGAINRRRVDDDLVSYVGFWPSKIYRIQTEYRRLYPEGRLHLYTWAALVLQAAGFISVGVCLLST